MTDTHHLLLWLQVLGGLGLCFVLAGLYISLYREAFLKYWTLGHLYAAVATGLLLLTAIWSPATTLQAYTGQLVVLPQYLAMVAAALSISHARLGRREILWIAAAGAGVMALQAVTGMAIADGPRVRQFLQLERYLVAAAAGAWFCAALWRKKEFRASAAGRITLAFSALQSLHNLLLAAARAGLPVSPAAHSPAVSLITALLPAAMGAGAVLLILQTLARSHRALEESEERYRALIATSPDAFTLTDMSGTLVLGNQRAAELFGYRRPEDLVGQSCDVLVAECDRGMAKACLAELFAGGVVRDRPLRFQRPDGTIFRGEVSATRLDGSGGQPVGWMAMTRDTTQRVESEERLRMLAYALRCAGDCISITDSTGHILYVNDAFLRTYEYQESEIIGQLTSVLRPAHQPDGSAVSLAAQGWRGELWNRSKNGRVFPISLATSVVHDEAGRAIASVGVSRDITELKQSEEARDKLSEQLRQAQKMESIGRLAGGVAHDFNNLLTVINGYGDLALRRLTREDPLFAYLTQIRRSGEQAAALTSQLLAFSRKQIARLAPFDLTAAVTDSAGMLRRLLGENVELATILDPETGLVMADGAQIVQVLMNLAINARDAMPEGGRLTIETRNQDLDGHWQNGMAAGPYVQLAVSDTGIGMDEDVRAHIFEPFFTTKEKGRGTGLGLSTVYGIVQQSHGWIWVYSEPGKGSTFKIYLPRVNGHVAPEAPVGAPDPVAGGHETVLLVEDQHELRRLARSVLEEHGYRLLEAATGEDALRIAAEFAGPIEILVTDVVLPGINGRELALQLGPLRREMRVLYTSGYSYDVLAPHGVLDPAVAYMPKPYSPRGLAERVREVLDAPPAARTVLVADDEREVRELLRDALIDAGYRVLTAEDGVEAMETVARERPQVVITDMVMPRQEGVETIRMLRQQYPEIKIIAMSGAFGGRFLATLEKLGADAGLAKPIDLGELCELVGKLLR